MQEGIRIMFLPAERQQRQVQPPVEGLELLQLQAQRQSYYLLMPLPPPTAKVIHRHGARSLWAPLSCWAKSRNAPIVPPTQNSGIAEYRT